MYYEVMFMLTVRLSKDLEHEIDIMSQQQRVTKSEIVKNAIIAYIKSNGKTPYDAGMDLFGCDDGNISDGSTRYKENIRRHIHEKYSN